MVASDSAVNDSEMQRRFGAKVDVTPTSARDRQVFLITGAGATLAGLVQAQGGQPLFSGPGWMLAQLGFSQAMSLRGSPEIRTVSGVSIDPERIDSLQRSLNPLTAP